MKEVILTVGPRASGKSSFCEKVIALDPFIVLISRDKLLLELFGETHLDPYNGGHWIVLQEMWLRVKEAIELSSGSRMILDTWNGSSEERSSILRRLRALGVDKITAWYFVTPVEDVAKWFFEKPDVTEISEFQSSRGQNLTFFAKDAPRRDHELFHRFAAGIDSEGFDEVVRINPLVNQSVEIHAFQISS